MEIKNKDICFFIPSFFFFLIIVFIIYFALFGIPINDRAEKIESIQSKKEELMIETRIDELSNKDGSLKENFNALEKKIANDYIEGYVRLPFSKDSSQEERLKVWDKLDNEMKTYIVVKSIYDDKKVPDKYIKELNNILKHDKTEKEKKIKKLTKKEKEKRKELKEYIRKLETESRGFFYVSQKDSGRYYVVPSGKTGLWALFSFILFILSGILFGIEMGNDLYAFEESE